MSGRNTPVVQRLNYGPNALEHRPFNAHAVDSGSGIVRTPGGEHAVFPRREQSLRNDEIEHPMAEERNPKHLQDMTSARLSPSPYNFSSTHPAFRQHSGKAFHNQDHQPPASAMARAHTPSSPSRDPRSRMPYTRNSPTPSQPLPSHPLPSSPVSPRWESRLQNSVNDRVATSAPASPVFVAYSVKKSYSTNESSHRSIDSVTSEVKQPVRSHTANTPVVVENFSRPRVVGGRPPYDTARRRSPTQVYPEPRQRDASGSWRPRSPDPADFSNQHDQSFPSLPIHNRDGSRGRIPQPPPLSFRAPRPYIRAESSGPSYTRDPIPRMASLPNDELRLNGRAQYTPPTIHGNFVAERTSIMTKHSIISIYGAVDDNFSIDDVLGLYGKGFDDDSAPEDNDSYDSPPPTATSEPGKEEIADNHAITEVPGEPAAPSSNGHQDERNSGTTLYHVDEVFTPPASTETAEDTEKIEGTEIPGIHAISDITEVPENTENIEDTGNSEITRFTEDAATERDSVATMSDATQIRSSTEFTPSPPVRRETNMTTTLDDERDRYGFKKSNQYITMDEYNGWESQYSKYLARRRKKWVLFLKESGLMTDNPNRFPPRSTKTKRFVRKGIPPEWRGAAWFYYAGGPAIVAKHAGLYNELLGCEVKEVDSEAIERDLHRTFPDNIKFRTSPVVVTGAVTQDSTSTRSSGQTAVGSEYDTSTDETSMISSLRRVLLAFSVYNPRIGYCQSLNFLAGLLLLFVESEEQAFWLLNIITRVYLPGTHEMSLEGANVDLGVLMASIRDTMPNVWAKIGGELDGTDAIRPKSRRHRQRSELSGRLPPITLCMTAWFMSCFIGTLPIESTLRVWDVFFYEGSKTLFRIALTIFKLGEAEIKTVGDPMEIFQVVQTIPRRILDANSLMEACYRRRNGFGHLSQETIELKRQERRRHVQAERERLAAGEPIISPDTDVRKKGTLFNRKLRD